MEPTNTNSTRKLLLWSSPIVLGHFFAVTSHLLLLVKVQPITPRFFAPLLVLFNLFPVAELVALAKGFEIGWKHDYSSSWDRAGHRRLRTFYQFRRRRLLRMPSGDLRLSSQISAVLLALLEAFAFWVGIRIFPHLSARPALNN
jgi:hypothetical protein